MGKMDIQDCVICLCEQEFYENECIVCGNHQVDAILDKDDYISDLEAIVNSNESAAMKLFFEMCDNENLTLVVDGDEFTIYRDLNINHGVYEGCYSASTFAEAVSITAREICYV